MFLFRHLEPLPVEDYDTEDYYNQDIYPLSTLFDKYAHKYAARLLSSAFSSSLIGKRLLAIQRSNSGVVKHQRQPMIKKRTSENPSVHSDTRSKKRCRCPSPSPRLSSAKSGDFAGVTVLEKGESSSSGVVKHQRQPIIEKRSSENPCVHFDTRSKKRCRCSSPSPRLSSAKSGDFAGVTVVEKGESSSSGAILNFTKARRSYREPPKTRPQIEEVSNSDSKNEYGSSGDKCKKPESPGRSNETMKPVKLAFSGRKAEGELENKLINKEVSSSTRSFAATGMNTTHPSPSQTKAKSKKKQTQKPTVCFPTWELQPRPTPTNAATIPPEFQPVIDEMGGAGKEVKFLLRKQLFSSDLKASQNRLPFSFVQLHNQFLTPEEFNEFEKKARVWNDSHGIDVKVIDTTGKVWTEFSLRRWAKYYGIITSWYQLVEDNKLKASDWLSVWYFRVNGQLVFVLVKE